MSRGLSKIQRSILGLLDGSICGQVFGNCKGGLETGELLEELEELDLVTTTNHRQGLFVVRRACRSLHARGLLQGTYHRGIDPPCPRVITWNARRDEK